MINHVLTAIIACYASLIFMGAVIDNNRFVKIKLIVMTTLVYLFHTVAFAELIYKSGETEAIVLFVSVIFLFITVEFVYTRFYAALSISLFLNVIFLMDIGMVMLVRLSAGKALRQFAFCAVAMCVCCVIPLVIKKVKKLEKFGYLYCALGLTSLIAVLIGGQSFFGAKNWFQLRHIVLQPSEFVKILYIFAMASLLTGSNRENPLELGKYTKRRMLSQLMISFFAALHILLLTMEKDLGGAFIYFCVYMAMFAIATGNYIFTSIGMLLGVTVSVASVFVFSHVNSRIIAWRDPFSVIESAGYQTAQSLFAIASGGFGGTGLYEGRPFDVPVVVSDFIFSAVCEELGTVFAVCMVFIYISILFLFLNLARNIKNEFYKYVSTGTIVLLGVQTFLNIGGAIKLIPSTGVTLPFVSYGGSSASSLIILIMIMQGIFELEGEEEIKSPKGFARLAKTDRRIFIISACCSGLLLVCICFVILFSASDHSELLANPYNRRF